MMTAMLTVRNIVTGERLYDTWAVNEDAEYHEAGDEGQVAAVATPAPAPELTAGERAALASVRDVPTPIDATPAKPASRAA